MHSFKYNRIYIKNKLSIGCHLILDSSIQHYLINVLRLKNGHYIRVFNDKDGEYIAQLSLINKKNVKLELCELLKQPSIDKNQLLLIAAPALIKNDRLHFTVEKSTELGITELAPIICSRSQSKTINMERIEKIVIEAVEQSEQLHVPIISPLQTLESFLNNNKCEQVIVADETINKDTNTIHNLPSSLFEKSIAVVIGPEGGFAPDEQTLFARYSNIQRISLGNNILRAETAMLSAIVQIQCARARLGLF